ncbi:MAG: S-methyl-5'-thioadenosine phosphorylase [Leptospiraceae bacterium]|nr:S-methyl-5'-thioadenosine phosphorylase [Leptospiraceae bacterium]
MSTKKADVAVIGGTGVYALEELQVIEKLKPETEWGYPSDEITIVSYPHEKKNLKIAFLPRHGKGHRIPPTTIPQKANMAALKQLGVDEIIAFSAVGSLQEHIAPGHFAIPAQIIDRTRFREDTYFNGGIVAHVSFGDPFSIELAEMIEPALKELNLEFHKAVTLICMEGPQFSTRAESRLYRSWGADIINMSVLPEAKLARELEMCYQMICMSTDYDSWRETSEAVNADEIMQVVKKNSQNAQKLLRAILPHWAKVHPLSSPIKEAMKFGIITGPDAQPEAEKKKLHSVLPQYF